MEAETTVKYVWQITDQQKHTCLWTTKEKAIRYIDQLSQVCDEDGGSIRWDENALQWWFYDKTNNIIQEFKLNRLPVNN